MEPVPGQMFFGRWNRCCTATVIDYHADSERVNYSKTCSITDSDIVYYRNTSLRFFLSVYSSNGLVYHTPPTTISQDIPDW